MSRSRSASRTPEPHTEITKDTESREPRITRMSRIARSALECGAAAPLWLFEPQRTRRTGQNLQNVTSQKSHRFDIRTSSLLRHSAFARLQCYARHCGNGIWHLCSSVLGCDALAAHLD